MVSKRHPLSSFRCGFIELLGLGLQVQNSKPAILFSDLVERSETGYCSKLMGKLWELDELVVFLFVSVCTYNKYCSSVKSVQKIFVQVGENTSCLSVFVEVTVSVLSGEKFWDAAFRIRFGATSPCCRFPS